MNKILTITAILMTVMFAASVLAGAVPTATQTFSANVAQCQAETDCTQTTLHLCTKDTTNTWQCIAGPTGTLTFDKINPHFKGTLTTTGLTPGTTYALVYYADPWAGSHPITVIATFTGAQSNLGLAIDQDILTSLPAAGDANIAPTPDYCLNHNGHDSYAHCAGAKIWVVPTSDLNPGPTLPPALPLLNWNPGVWLFETDLVTYTDATPTPITCVQSQCVAKACGISAGNIDFGNIVPGTTTSGNDISTVSNSGNTPASLYIKGTNWDNGMSVGQTSWSVDSKTTWTALTLGDVSTGASVPASGSKIVNFGLTVPSNAPIGATHQTITFTGSC